MHIAIDARVINSGTGTYVSKLLEYLQQIDAANQYTVLVRKKDEDYWHPSADNFTVKVAEFDNYSFAEQIGFKKFLDDLSPDLVHFCMPQQPLLYKGKRVTTMHDMTLLHTYNSDKNWLVFRLKQFIGRFVWRHVAKISDHVITISEYTRREYQEFSHIPDDKLSMIYEAAEAHIDRLEIYDNLPFENFIMYVGQQPDYKNIRRLILAHQKLLDTYQNLGLVLAGRMNPDTESNKSWSESHNHKNVLFTGYIPDEQRDWLFTKTKAYVFPSLMEGFGLPPLEAMAYGTPVVSSNSSCMPEVLGDAAMYFNPLDVEDMADSIARVLDDDKLRDSLIELGHKQVARYSWRKMAEETHAVYMRVLNEK